MQGENQEQRKARLGGQDKRALDKKKKEFAMLVATPKNITECVLCLTAC